ncbi:MAG: hypothetical protein WCD79_15515 [Chthoniobacteraceae bacterium]
MRPGTFLPLCKLFTSHRHRQSVAPPKVRQATVEPKNNVFAEQSQFLLCWGQKNKPKRTQFKAKFHANKAKNCLNPMELIGNPPLNPTWITNQANRVNPGKSKEIQLKK